MITTVLVIAYIAIAVIFTAILCLYGYKKGLISGAFVLCTGLLSAVLASVIAPALAPVLCDISVVSDIKNTVVGTTTDIGVYSDTLGKTVDATFLKVMEIPAAIILFIGIFILLSIASMIIKKCAKLVNGDLTKKSKLIGTVLAGVMPMAVLLFSIVFAKIDLFAEAKRVDELMPVFEKSDSEIIKDICTDTDKYTDFYFDTTIIAADENKKLEIVNNGLSSLVTKINDPALTEIYNFEGYKTRDALCGELKNVGAIYNGISEEVDIFADGDIMEKFKNVKSIDTAVDNLYKLQIRDIILRFALTKSVREIIDSDDFLYPEDIGFDGTQEDMVLLINTAQEISDGNITALSAAVKLIDSPLVNSDIVAQLVEIGIKSFDQKIQQFINDSRIIEKIRSGEVDTAQLKDLIAKIENGTLLEEINILQQLPPVDEAVVKDFIENIEDEIIPEGFDKEDIGDILQGDYSSIFEQNEIPNVSDISDIINDYINNR